MFDQLEGVIWMNGELLPWKEAKLHVMTHALHYASSVYEGLRSYGGRVLESEKHYQRFHESAHMCDFEIPFSKERLIEVTKDLARSCGFDQGYIRSIAWCGSHKMTVSHRGADVNVAIGIWDRPLSYPRSYFSEGITLNVAKWRRPDSKTAPVHAKAAGLYMISSMSKAESERLGFHDALMLDSEGFIAEATSSNIFFVRDSKLYTPLPTCFLKGITRQTFIDIAKEAGIDVIEGHFTLEELAEFEEAFLTGTAIEMIPIKTIQTENQTYSFMPGLMTQKLHDNFKQKIQLLRESPL